MTIIGAGLAGTLMGLYLCRRGWQVDVFERWGDPRCEDVPAGRSINLALAERGIHALDQVGVLDSVMAFALPMRGRMVHPLQGDTVLQPYGQRPDEVIYSVHRARLNLALIEAADEHECMHFHFDRELAALDISEGKARFVDSTGSSHEHAVYPMIAADGAGSLVRQALEDATGVPAAVELLDHGYRELTIPPAEDGGHRLDPDALHIWPRGGYMCIALPNADGSFTVTLFMANTGETSFEQLDKLTAFSRFMGEQFPDLTPYLTQLAADFENPVGILGTVRAPCWYLEDRLCLIGDAAHAIVPFHGQGMNAAFEDCEKLAACLDRHDDLGRAFEVFAEQRRPNANAIADMALENYLEMRSDVIDPGYVLRRELALELERRHPEHFVPRYAMVMFRRIPYVEAQRRGEINKSILLELTAGRTTLAEVDFAAAEALIHERLPAL